MRYLLILGLFFLLSCKNNQSITGKYESKKFNSIQNKSNSLRKVAYTTGSSLKINNDSSYEMINCGNIMKGNWKVVQDTLFLFCKSNEYRSDSLNAYGFNGKQLKCYDKPDFFIINGDELCQVFKEKQNGYSIYKCLIKRE
ncbi:MAG: hypothetical protein V4613_14440 [Bacteroidota bacterium]